MHYPSLTKKLLLATILSVGATLPTYASALDEGSQEAQGGNVQGLVAQPEPVAFDLDTQNALAPTAEVVPTTVDALVLATPIEQPAESGGLFGWMFGAKKADVAPTSSTTQEEIKTVAQEPAQTQTTPSQEVVETPKATAIPSSTSVPSSEATLETTQVSGGWSFNPLTLFGLIGSSTPLTPILDVVAPLQITPEEVKTSLSTDIAADSQDEDSAVEGTLWQPEPQSEASSSQQANTNPFGVISHELFGFDPSQSTMFDLQAALAQVKENKRSFKHSYSIESRLSSVTLPSGDLFSIYPEAKYTLALGDIKIDFSGQELHASIESGKTLNGLALFSVQTDTDETALFRIKDTGSVSFVPANHLFFDPLKAGAELQDTPSPFGLFFADEKSFTLGQDDLVTFKIFGENFKTTTESLKRVGSSFVESFLNAYKNENVLRVNRISRDGKFVYKRSQ